MKKISRILLFFLIFALLLAPVTLLLIPKDNTEEAGMLRVEANGIRSQPKDSIDVIFLGTSEILCGISPLDIWEQSGITGFNCAGSNLHFLESIDLLETAFQTQSPKVVVVGTDMFAYECHYYDILSHKITKNLQIISYHDRWKSLTAADFFRLPHYTAPGETRGFRAKAGAKTADVSHYMEPSEERIHVSRWNVFCLKEIDALCRKNGAKLMLYSVPCTTIWTYSRHNTMSDLAQSMGIPYVDGNLSDLGLDWTRDSVDGGVHMNHLGAEKIAHFFADYLKERYDLPDHRKDPAYAGWDTDTQALRRLEAQLEEKTKDTDL